MRKHILLILLSFFLITQSHAAVSVSAISAEIGAVLNYKSISRGFASNDPRYAATLAAVGTAAQVIGSTVAVGTAPAWGSIIAAAAVSTAVGFGIQSLLNWYFNKDGTVTVTSPAAPDPATPKGMCWGWPANNFGICSSSKLGAISEGKSKVWTSSHISWGGDSCPYFIIDGQCSSKVADGPSLYTIPAGVTPTQASPVTSTVPISTALASLSSADSAKPLLAADLAVIADAAWKNAAAQPGYSGLPYINNDPITSADVTAARAANPTMATSTVADLASSIPITNAVTQPDGQPQVNPGTSPSSQPLENLGPDPGIGAPALEPTPTAAQILAPIISLFPDLRSFVVPSHQSVCPTSSMSLWNHTLTLDSHCAMLEKLRPTLYAVMALVWALLALFIILAA